MLLIGACMLWIGRQQSRAAVLGLHPTLPPPLLPAAGRHLAMEAHLVHKNLETGNLAVLGVFIEVRSWPVCGQLWHSSGAAAGACA